MTEPHAGHDRPMAPAHHSPDTSTAGEVDPTGHGDHAGHGGHAGHAGHGGHAGHAWHGDHVARFRRLFWINLLLAIPVVGFSSIFARLLGYALPDVPGVSLISPLLGTVLYVWGWGPFLPGPHAEPPRQAPGVAR